MKKKRITRKEIEEFAWTILALVLLAMIFSFLCGLFEAKPQESISQEENIQLNEIEQYHCSEGRNIKFIEDIIK